MDNYKQTLVLTKEQRKALKRIYDRSPLWDMPHNRQQNMNTFDYTWGDVWNDDGKDEVLKELGAPKTYREFRRSVHFMYDCIGVWWRGIFLGIEHDGYTHS